MAGKFKKIRAVFKSGKKKKRDKIVDDNKPLHESDNDTTLETTSESKSAAIPKSEILIQEEPRLFKKDAIETSQRQMNRKYRKAQEQKVLETKNANEQYKQKVIRLNSEIDKLLDNVNEKMRALYKIKSDDKDFLILVENHPQYVVNLLENRANNSLTQLQDKYNHLRRFNEGLDDIFTEQKDNLQKIRALAEEMYNKMEIIYKVPNDKDRSDLINISNYVEDVLDELNNNAHPRTVNQLNDILTVMEMNNSALDEKLLTLENDSQQQNTVAAKSTTNTILSSISDALVTKQTEEQKPIVQTKQAEEQISTVQAKQAEKQNIAAQAKRQRSAHGVNVKFTSNRPATAQTKQDSPEQRQPSPVIPSPSNTKNSR